MKHFNFFKRAFFALLILCSNIAWAQTFEVDGIYYNITDTTAKTVEVTKNRDGSGFSYWFIGAVTIPEDVTYNGITYSVTGIGGYAFDGCTGLTAIEIPNSVTSIGESAFDGTAWYNNQPDGVVYAGKVLYKYKGTMPENTSITIKEGTLSISDYAFDGCTSLTAIEIPNSVTSIGAVAFAGCTGLTAIEIPSSVTSIGYRAFYRTAWYNNQPDGVVYAGKVLYAYKGTMPENTSITIKEGTIRIARSAFSGCTGLTSITISNSVTSIGEYAFSGCTGLTNITIPNSVTSIGGLAFYYCI